MWRLRTCGILLLAFLGASCAVSADGLHVATKAPLGDGTTESSAHHDLAAVGGVARSPQPTSAPYPTPRPLPTARPTSEPTLHLPPSAVPEPETSEPQTTQAVAWEHSERTLVGGGELASDALTSGDVVLWFGHRGDHTAQQQLLRSQSSNVSTLTSPLSASASMVPRQNSSTSSSATRSHRSRTSQVKARTILAHN